MLNPTPPALLIDERRRPYFLWDNDMTLEEFQTGLNGEDPVASAYLIGKLMRQAKPDDVLTFVPLSTISSRWSEIERYLGNTHAFWAWLVDTWKARARVGP